MPKLKPLLLSHQQWQTLVDLGIDAWYLTPLVDTEGKKKYQANQAKVAQIVEELKSIQSLEKTTLQQDEQSTTDSLTSTDSPPATDVEPHSETVAKSTLSTSRVAPSQHRQTPLPPVQLHAQMDITPPSDTVITLADTDECIEHHVEAIDKAIEALGDSPMLASASTLKPQGSVNAKWLVVLPPPSLSHIERQQLFNDDEQQLFNEVLAGLKQSKDQIYLTPLIKQAMDRQRDPDETILKQHLPILHAEIRCLNPERIIVMGRVSNHVLLQTKAPLAKLMSIDYQLAYDTQTTWINALPSLDYFLAMPSEKQLLWQSLKPLISA